MVRQQRKGRGGKGRREEGRPYHLGGSFPHGEGVGDKDVGPGQGGQRALQLGIHVVVRHQAHALLP